MHGASVTYEKTLSPIKYNTKISRPAGRAGVLYRVYILVVSVQPGPWQHWHCPPLTAGTRAQVQFSENVCFTLTKGAVLILYRLVHKKYHNCFWSYANVIR